MKIQGIQTRVMLLALGPATLIACLLAVYFTFNRIADAEQALRQLGAATAQHLASSAEYALVTGNRAMLQTLADNAVRDSNTRYAIITDAQTVRLAAAGFLPSGMQTHVGPQVDPHDYVFSAPVTLSQVDLQDAFSLDAGGSNQAQADKPLGFVVVAMSRASLEQSRRHMLLTGFGIVAVGLAGTLALAWAWGRGITRPVRELSGTVAELERGNLEARADPSAGGELLMLQTGFNRMADALQVQQSELERRIRAATADLASKKDEAERANREKSAFLAAVSHDLRQPMHAVGLFAATLRDRVSSPDQAELVQRIEDSLSALHGMFDALLNISRLDAGAVEAHLQPCHLKDLLQRAWQDFQPVAEEKKLHLRVRVCDGWAMSDPMLLGRMVNNLVSNAIRYTERGGVLLGCRRRGDRWLIEVWDTGVGIAEDHLPHIFDEYFQVGNAERNRARGVGLGLAIVQKISGLLGHPIEVRSRPGRGTVFRISVPAGESRNEDRRAGERSAGQFAGEAVLVIEDDQAALEAMATLLSSWGLKPISASGLEEAREALRRGTIPGVILSDYRLPQTSGIAVVRALIGELGREIPALLITGDTAEDSLATMKASGLPILHKPLRPAKLRAMLSAQLQRD